ncbi:hypothetical protein V8E54_008889 [Elaphomyces granulatus]
MTTKESQQLPGDNQAYFCSSLNQQLFKIEEFDIAPNPPVVDHRFFGYLSGYVPDVPNLNDTSLRISSQKDDGETRHIEEKLVKCPNIIMRRDGRYSHELKPGRIDFLADFVIFGMFVETGNYTFTMEAKLPDGRVLFCFQSSMFLKGRIGNRYNLTSYILHMSKLFMRSTPH